MNSPTQAEENDCFSPEDISEDFKLQFKLHYLVYLKIYLSNSRYLREIWSGYRSVEVKALIYGVKFSNQITSFEMNLFPNEHCALGIPSVRNPL